MVKKVIVKNKKLKNKSSDIHEEIRHLGVVIENVNDGVKLMAEKHLDIKKAINGIKKTLNSHSKK